MKIKMGNVISCLFMLILLAGCINSNPANMPRTASTNKPLTMEQILTQINEQEIVNISIYKSEVHGTIGKTLIKKLSSGEDTVVLRALKSAEQIPGILDTTSPDYDFVISLNNDAKYAFHFWLKSNSESLGMLANIVETEKGYSLSKESTQEILNLLE